MTLRILNLKKQIGEGVLSLALIAAFLAQAPFLFAAEKSPAASGPLAAPHPAEPPRDSWEGEAPQTVSQTETRGTSRRRIFKRIPTLAFRDDEVHDVRLGYGMHVQLELPEKIKAAVPPDERLVSLDYLDDRIYLKGIADAVGEITNATIITESGKSLHLFIRIVEPEESDQGFKFVVPTKRIFSESYVKKEVAKATEERERELESRESGLDQVTENLAQEKIKQKLLREEKTPKKIRAKEDSLEMKDVQVTRLGDRVYVKFTLQNRSQHDFAIGTVLASRGRAGEPKNSDLTAGLKDIQIEEPTFESQVVPAGGETKALLAFENRQVRDLNEVNLNVIEDGGMNRAARFKNLKLFAG